MATTSISDNQRSTETALQRARPTIDMHSPLIVKESAMAVMLLNRRALVVAAAAALSAGNSWAAAAQELDTPKGTPILSISGRIGVTNGDGLARFDRDMLESLGLTTFTTMTPWYDAPMTFEGVSLDRLMRVVGATGDQLRAKALDDYTTEIPIADFATFHPILALRRNGEYLPIKDKGPLFIVYPFDSDPQLKHQRFYSRSAWQVVRMTVI